MIQHTVSFVERSPQKNVNTTEGGLLQETYEGKHMNGGRCCASTQKSGSYSTRVCQWVLNENDKVTIRKTFICILNTVQDVNFK